MTTLFMILALESPKYLKVLGDVIHMTFSALVKVVLWIWSGMPVSAVLNGRG